MIQQHMDKDYTLNTVCSLDKAMIHSQSILNFQRLYNLTQDDKNKKIEQSLSTLNLPVILITILVIYVKYLLKIYLNCSTNYVPETNFLI